MQSHTIIARIPRYHPYPPWLPTPHHSLFLSLVGFCNAESGFLIDFLGAAPYTVSTTFISSSYTPTCRFPLYRHRFPQCLCIVYPLPSFFPSLCCFGSLYKSITYDNDPPHSGHSSSITDPHSHSFFPLRTLCCVPCYSFRPRQPPLFVRYGL